MLPTITKLSNGTLFNFQEQMITVTTHRVKVGSDGNISGEIDIETTRPATPPSIFYGRVNFLSLSGRQDLARHLQKAGSDIPWAEILETVIRHTITTTRRAGVLEKVSSNDEVPDIQFHLFPFIQRDQPTTLFGDGASGKSYLALLMAAIVRNGWWDNSLDLKINEDNKGQEVVWLDYETSKHDFIRRLNAITNGLEMGFCDIFYRHCTHNIIDEIDELSPLVNQHEPGLIVIDSIGAACAGDLHGSESPTLFFNAIRRLSGSKLLLFHSNKEKELYGNRFFWNFSRHVWEVKKQQIAGDDMLSVGLFHRKANETKLFNPFAFNFIFEGNVTKVERADITGIPELAASLSLRQRMEGLLKSGSMQAAEIAEALNEKEVSIRSALNRNKNKFVKTDGNKWGLLFKE